jgi:hypothetical protein
MSSLTSPELLSSGSNNRSSRRLIDPWAASSSGEWVIERNPTLQVERGVVARDLASLQGEDLIGQVGADGSPVCHLQLLIARPQQRNLQVAPPLGAIAERTREARVHLGLRQRCLRALGSVEGEQGAERKRGGIDLRLEGIAARQPQNGVAAQVGLADGGGQGQFRLLGRDLHLGADLGERGLFDREAGERHLGAELGAIERALAVCGYGQNARQIRALSFVRRPVVRGSKPGALSDS